MTDPAGDDTADRTPALRLRPLAPADGGLVRRWLATPAVRQWWGSAASAEAEIRLASESTTALCRIALLGGEPIGYCHAVEAGALNAALPPGIQPGTWDCDVFIGSEPHRGKGFGAAALDLLADEVFRSTLAVACMIRVSIRNEAAVRAFERAGFHWRSITEDPLTGPSWLLVRDRA